MKVTREEDAVTTQAEDAMTTQAEANAATTAADERARELEEQLTDKEGQIPRSRGLRRP